MYETFSFSFSFRENLKFDRLLMEKIEQIDLSEKSAINFIIFRRDYSRGWRRALCRTIFADNRPGIRCTCLNCPAIISDKKRRRRSYLDGSTSFSSRPVAVISRKRIGCSLESGQDSFRRTCLDGYQLANVPRTSRVKHT